MGFSKASEGRTSHSRGHAHPWSDETQLAGYPKIHFPAYLRADCQGKPGQWASPIAAKVTGRMSCVPSIFSHQGFPRQNAFICPETNPGCQDPDFSKKRQLPLFPVFAVGVWSSSRLSLPSLGRISFKPHLKIKAARDQNSRFAPGEYGGGEAFLFSTICPPG